MKIMETNVCQQAAEDEKRTELKDKALGWSKFLFSLSKLNNFKHTNRPTTHIRNNTIGNQAISTPADIHFCSLALNLYSRRLSIKTRWLIVLERLKQ